VPAPLPLRAPLYVVDAFTTRVFSGNPAAVVPLDRFEPDPLLKSIAAEHNLSETAFLVRDGSDYRLRWFTPTDEVPLCGHATLASAAVVMERLEPARTSVIFHTLSGPLTVRRTGEAYSMDFPAQTAAPVATPAPLVAALRATPSEVLANDGAYVAIFDREAQVRALTPDFPAVARLDRWGVIVSAPGTPPFDFVSRCFAPAHGIEEDPVTGSAHCVLLPYWSGRLGKSSMRAFQASRRGGEIGGKVVGDRVLLTGTCAFYSEGTITVSRE
jgi:PhzF family phenazine biosynthesis protein